MNKHLLKLFICLLSFSPNQELNTQVTGKIIDFVSQKPLKNQTVKIYQRAVGYHKGYPLLLPSNQSKLVGETTTNKEGRYTFNSLSQQGIYIIETNSKDYQTNQTLYFNAKQAQQITCIKKHPSQEEQIEIEAKQKKIIHKQNIKRAQMQAIHEFEDASKYHNSSQKSSCTFSEVPDYVFVQNLVNDYNGRLIGNGFTGYIHFDEYVAGVVNGEVAYSSSLEAKKAQAVAARTYSLYRHLNQKPVNINQAFSYNPDTLSIQAAHATSKIVILYNNKVIDAKYHARCNGQRTQDATEGTWVPYAHCSPEGKSKGYLKSVNCTGHSNCQARNENPCCEVYNSQTGSYGNVYGHGVGMCQRGMMVLGTHYNYTFDQILNRYYTNICIANFDTIPDSCSTKYTTLLENTTYNIMGSTTSQIDQYSCTAPDLHSGPEHHFSFTPSHDGAYTIKITNNNSDVTIYHLLNCSDQVCQDYAYNTLEIYPAWAGIPVHFILDQQQDSGQDFTIEIIHDAQTGSCQSLKSSTSLTLDSVHTYASNTFSATDGLAHAFFSGGLPPYYLTLISDQQDTIKYSTSLELHEFENLSMGEYTLEIEDAAGCSDFRIFNINGPACNLQANFEINPATSGNDGSANASLWGGFEPYQVTWILNTQVSQGLTLEQAQAGQYDVHVQDNVGCQYLFDVTIPFDSLSTSNIFTQETQLQVFPNPFNDQIHIKSNQSIDKLHIFNQIGALIITYDFEEQSTQKTIDLSDLSSGLYYLQSQDKNKAIRLIKY